MKKLFAVLVTTIALFAASGCTIREPGATNPMPGKLSGSFWSWIEDTDGNEIIHDIVITIDGFADGPDGARDPRWQDTGMPASMPMELHKRSPFNQPIYWDPGQTITLLVTVFFEDAQLGDRVQCWQDDASGVKVTGSERTFVRQLPGRGTISVNCNFIFR